MKTLTTNLLTITPILPLLVGCATESSNHTSTPNVIVILADDLGYGELGSYGATHLETPNLDALSNGGIRFTDGHATSATSTPSRYALFTGVYPWKNPRARVLAGDAPLLIDTTQYTLPKMFKSKGYKTAAIGKWHLGMGSGNPNWNERVSPGASEIGFDYSCLIAATNDRVPTVYVENGRVLGADPSDPIEVSYKKNFEGEPTALTNPEMLKMTWAHGHNQSIVNGIPRIGYMKGGESAKWVDEDMADFFVERVAKFIDESKESPFFLYYGLHQPHVPRAPHSRFVGKTTLGARGDAIVEADWCIGELIAKLEREGLLENTLIVFSSDNGAVLNDGYNDMAAEMIGDHKPSGGYRGGKYSLYDAGTRVPFFTYWKGVIAPAVSNKLVSQIDLLASFAELLGVELPEGIDSQPYLDQLLYNRGEARDNLVVEANGRLAYRKGRYAMVPPSNNTPKINKQTGSEMGSFSSYSLFDLESDPMQLNDLALEQTALLEELKGEFLEITSGYYNEKQNKVMLKSYR